MDPISLSIAAISVGISAFGGFEKYQGAQQQTATQIQMVQTEQSENNLRQQMLNLSANRERMDILRRAQQGRALALAGAAAHGAQFGSGLAGGFGQISGQANLQTQKVNQDTEAGNTMFGLQNQLSSEKIDYAKEGGLINQGQGLMDIGRTLASSNQQLTSLTKLGMQGINQSFISPFSMNQGMFGFG